MAPSSREQLKRFVRGIGVRQVRLVCGLVLFAYLVSHFLNHALGNISMDPLAIRLPYPTLFWQFLPVAIAFYTAALVHTDWLNPRSRRSTPRRRRSSTTPSIRRASVRRLGNGSLGRSQ